MTNPSEKPKKQRVHRTMEQRIRDLEAMEAKIREKLLENKQKVDDAKASILKTPKTAAARKNRIRLQLHFQSATDTMVPDWDERHFIAAIERAMEEDTEALLSRGEHLLQQHGSNRRGCPRK